MRHFISPILSIVILASFVGKGCINPQEYPVEPEISNATVSDSIIQEGIDSLVVSFEFQDGDGDLGNKKGDTITNIFFIDQRTGFEYTYQMPVIGDREQSVDGTVWVTLDPYNITCRPFNDGRDTVGYDIYVVDRAENRSNMISTPKVIIQCE